MILPAALCCSLTAVQVGFLLLQHNTPTRVSFLYDPGSTLRTHNRWALYLTTCAAPQSAAGPFSAFAIIASCAVWPTPLNTVAAAVLLNRVRSWSQEAPIPRGAPSPALSPASSPINSPRGNHAAHAQLRSPLARDSVYSNFQDAAESQLPVPYHQNIPEESRFRPFLPAHDAQLLAFWVAFQITISNILQMPMLTKYAKGKFLGWAHIGIIVDTSETDADTVVQNGIRVAVHAALLAALYLFLTAVRCSADPDTRLWPKRSPFVSHVAAFLADLPEGRSPGSRLAAVGDAARHHSALGLNGALNPHSAEGYGAVGAANPGSDAAAVPQDFMMRAHQGKTLQPIFFCTFRTSVLCNSFAVV